MPSVRLNGLRKTFGDVVAVEDMTVEFEEGAMTSVLGPSGCGKTTTLNLIAGFAEPDRGTIYFGNRPIVDPTRGIAVAPNHRDLGMVFQSYALWPHLTIGENVAYGLKMRRVPRAERDSAVKGALRTVQLETYVDRYPHELSGGQQQRVAFARALAYSPAILLFDEPLSNLDAHLREEIRFEIREIHRRIGITAIYVTHDQAEAMVLSDRIVVMEAGWIRQVGTPRELYERPAGMFVAGFIGKTNLLPAQLLERQEGWGVVRLDARPEVLRCRCSIGTDDNARGYLSIRPEGIRLQPLDPVGGDARLTSRVCASTYLGNLHEYKVALSEDTVLDVQQAGGEELKVGEVVALDIDPRRACFLVEHIAGGSTPPTR
jgi:ABC-type Fe3+/spermidine/putrescine transport system ATPase subunit